MPTTSRQSSFSSVTPSEGQAAASRAGRAEAGERGDGWQDYVGLALKLAARTGRHPDHDEMRQVALIALWKAWQRCDPEREAEFSSFAYRTISGELKRHRRDTGWMIRPPRAAHDNLFRLAGVIEQLTHELSRSPTVAEIAERAGLSEEEAILAIEAGSRGHSSSLDEIQSVVGDSHPVLRQSGRGVEERVVADDSLSRALGALGDRDRKVVELRFFADMTQREIAGEVGLSQMQVSRVLRASLRRLREVMSAGGDEGALPAAAGGG